MQGFIARLTLLLALTSFNCAVAANFSWAAPHVPGWLSSASSACEAVMAHYKDQNPEDNFRMGSPFYRDSSSYYLRNYGKPADEWDKSAGSSVTCNIEREGVFGWAYGGVGAGEAINLMGSTCPGGTTFGADGKVGCVPNVTPNPETNNGLPKCPGGNPINIATGNKFQSETDWSSSSNPLFKLERYYNSTEGLWRFSYESGLIRVTESSPRCAVDTLSLDEFECLSKIEYQAELVSSNGQELNYKSLPVSTIAESEGEWTSGMAISTPLIKRATYSDENVTLNDVFERKSGARTEVYVYESASEGVVVYRLRYVNSGYGHVINIERDNSSITVSDTVGRSLSLSLNGSGVIESASLPDNYVIGYQYNGDGMLSKITYPDSFKYYLYETSTPTLLTGIVDEKGVRYASWSYDSEGRAYESFHGDGIDRVSMVFNTNGSTTVTNPKGKTTTYFFKELRGGLKVPSNIQGDASASCIASNSAYTYDSNGFIASKTDWEGNVTTFVHNSQGQETSRTEATGTPEDKTVITEWHSDFRLPTKITEPNRITIFTYSDTGLLLNKTVMPQEPQL